MEEIKFNQKDTALYVKVEKVLSISQSYCDYYKGFKKWVIKKLKLDIAHKFNYKIQLEIEFPSPVNLGDVIMGINETKWMVVEIMPEFKRIDVVSIDLLPDHAYFDLQGNLIIIYNTMRNPGTSNP